MRRRPQAALGAKKQKVPEVLTRAGQMYTRVSGHTGMFPAPPVTMVIFKQQIDALTLTQAAAVARAPAAAATRKPTLDGLWTSMQLLCGYAQFLADAAPDRAEAIIEAAGCKVAAAAKYVKPLLLATPRPGGAVNLEANVAALRQGVPDAKSKSSQFFSWQQSTDGGQTWSAPITSNRGHVTLRGLPRKTEVAFRVAITCEDEQGAWSPMVTVYLP